VWAGGTTLDGYQEAMRYLRSTENN
jgi:hypothetical protein